MTTCTTYFDIFCVGETLYLVDPSSTRPYTSIQRPQESRPRPDTSIIGLSLQTLLIPIDDLTLIVIGLHGGTASVVLQTNCIIFIHSHTLTFRRPPEKARSVPLPVRDTVVM